jgi:hypothetical protein
MDTIRSWLVEHKLRAVGMFSSYPTISFIFLGRVQGEQFSMP